MTEYTEKDLRRQAVLAVREQAKREGIRARCYGYSIVIVGHRGDAVLVAHGEETAPRDGRVFDVNVAI